MSVHKIVKDSLNLHQLILENTDFLNRIQTVASICSETFRHNGKILLCGNGGSAADAQHIAAELSGRFYYDRAPLYAEALHVNSSYLTAVANDYHFDQVYSRMVEAAGKNGDVLIGLSTSGNSNNIVKALQSAKAKGMITIGLTGESGGIAKNFCDVLLNVPSTDTPRIQEIHILVGHILCELIEKSIFPKDEGI